MGNDRARVVRLTLLGTDIATWTNERPYPGARFSWGPSNSGALVYVGEKGQLVFFDQQKQKRAITSHKDAVLPAWSADGRASRTCRRPARRSSSSPGRLSACRLREATPATDRRNAIKDRRGTPVLPGFGGDYRDVVLLRGRADEAIHLGEEVRGQVFDVPARTRRRPRAAVLPEHLIPSRRRPR